MPRKPIATEKRESRINLLLVPSLYKGVVTLADSQELSVNEFITRLLEKTVDKNSAIIEKFRKAREEAQNDFSDAD